jgi:hypothetical protein
MLLVVPAGQFYGGLLEDLVWITVALWLIFIRPRSIRRKVASGELRAADADAKSRKVHPLLGYALLFFGISQTYVSFSQVGLFGRFDTLAGIVMLGATLGFLVFAYWRYRKAKHE